MVIPLTCCIRACDDISQHCAQICWVALMFECARARARETLHASLAGLVSHIALFLPHPPSVCARVSMFIYMFLCFLRARVGLVVHTQTARACTHFPPNRLRLHSNNTHAHTLDRDARKKKCIKKENLGVLEMLARALWQTNKTKTSSRAGTHTI